MLLSGWKSTSLRLAGRSTRTEIVTTGSYATQVFEVADIITSSRRYLDQIEDSFEAE